MINLEEIQTQLSKSRLNVERRTTEKSVFENRKVELSEEIESLKSDTEILDRVTLLLNSIGESRQQEAQEKIEGIVTKGLQTIFGDHISFHINQSMKGKNASVDFSIKSLIGNSIVETPVMGSHGGGLAAVIGFLLRVTVMLLDKGTQSANVLVLDESFGMVSSEYLDELAAFVKELVDKTGIQIILITHQPEWEEYADKVYKFGIKSGETYIK